jgi:hypothetical protein
MAAVTAIAAGVSATAATAGALMSWQEAQAQKEDVEKLKGRRGEQAADILDQIGAEEVIYEDELDMIRKQTEMAGQKLLAGTEAGIEKIGEQASGAVAQTYGGKYDTGAGARQRLEVKSDYEESLSDIKGSYELGMEEVALRDEEAERQAMLRHEEIVGSLEAQREELLAML